MIPEAKALKLIEIYFYVCKVYEENLQFFCQRFSNNDEPEFTDQEIMTIYLFVTNQEQKFVLTQIHRFANEYLRSWFPKLGTYTAFITRLNRMPEAFRMLASNILHSNLPQDCDLTKSVLDSVPIITCSGKRSSKVAREITDKTYSSTKNMWYYGLKLHFLGFCRPSKLPYPEDIVITKASENDLNVFKESWGSLENRVFFGDKIYIDTPYFKKLKEAQNSEMMTPIKSIKGHSIEQNQRDFAYNELYSKAVSAIRQPVESFFNWIIQKTDIQRASKVRSTNGLLVHVYAKISAAFIGLIFNP
ncbi:MAG: transposase [Bacteroidetes bacterium GWF2_33_38]|nr:MAG: transposase [Bacteroidetes bacterium GWF2_33_38]